MGRATEILMTGEEVGAAAAERIGLANRVVPDGQALPAALEWAGKLAAGPGLALGTTKRLLENEWTMGLTAALESEAQAQALLLMGQDHRAFYEAFAKKVPPQFTGR
jgi:enoyl-CoA hydratase/carnithine racemase